MEFLTILTYEQSAKSNGVCLATVINTVKKYFEGGIDAVTKFKRNVNSDMQDVCSIDMLKHVSLCFPVDQCQKDIQDGPFGCLKRKQKLFLILDTPVSREAIPRAIKNKLRPHENDYRCILSKDDAEFIACMEDVLDVYELPYNTERTVVCMVEKPYQLLGDAREELFMRPGDNKKIDSEYIRNGICSIFAFVEPLGEIHLVSVQEHRTAFNWAEEIKYLVDVLYPDVEKIILVMDNLNTHKPAFLYKRYPTDEAGRIIKHLEIHYTPKYGSFLDIAEIELNVMTIQCLSRRIENIANLREELAA